MSVVAVPVPATVTPAVTEADVLTRAADLLEEFGWCQGTVAKDEHGNRLADPLDIDAHSFCAGGAFHRAWYELTGNHDDNVFARRSKLSPLLGVDPGQEQFWNDAPDRTAAEVVARLRDAAILARRQA